ncbi:MAG: mechanosensitive ion channel family protein, partial [Thermotoga sp.]
MKEIVIKVVLTVLTLAISYVLFKQVYKWLLKLILKFNKEFRMQNTLKLILGIVISIFVLFIVLDIWDVSLLPLITGLGIGGIVAGFALQEPLSNLVAGIFLLSSGTVKEGEVLDIGGTAGTVEAVYLNHTLIKTFDGKRVYIPNKIVWNERIT